MKVVYMCHPVAGDIKGNLARAKRWLRWLEENYPIAIVASWITECEVWDDNNPEQRAAGLERDKAVLERCDGIVLVGGRISNGMAIERAHAESKGLPVTDMTGLGAEPPRGTIDVADLGSPGDKN